MDTLLSKLTLEPADELERCPPSGQGSTDDPQALPQYNLPSELWRKIFIHAAPSRVLDNGCTNSIEEQEGSLCGLGFWRISHASQYTRYNICLVSHAFRELCTPLLYRDVKLSNSNAILHFGRTILEPDPSSSQDFPAFTFRMDVDLSPYLNRSDEHGDPLLDEAGLGPDGMPLPEPEFADDSEVGTVARLLNACTNLKMFLWDSTENLHMLPSLVLDAIARSPCASKLVGLDWFPVSEANLMSFFTMLYAVQGVEHIEVGETLDLMYSYNPTAERRVDLPKLHTLAISGDGISTCRLFSEMNLPSLRRLTHWSGLSPIALWTLDVLLAAHGHKLEVVSIWSPSGQDVIPQVESDNAIKGMLGHCPNLSYLELDIFNPYPLPSSLSPHPSIRHISLGLELVPIKELGDPLFHTAETSPMSELVYSISRKKFPKLESVHILSMDQTAMFFSKEAMGAEGGRERRKGKRDWGGWEMLEGWCRWAEKDGWVIKDGWGDIVKAEDWEWEDDEKEEMREEAEEADDLSALSVATAAMILTANAAVSPSLDP